MFLSIVIPVYNASCVIERCLDSIWSQDLPLEEYEVICVDDGSVDDSVEIIKTVSKSHSQLIIVKNDENVRAGGARNHGVRIARGEYVLFIDSDDYFHPGGLREAFEYQKSKRLDILMCDFARHKDHEPNDTLVHNFKSEKVMTGRRFLVVNSLPYAPWKYLFRRRLMTDNDVWFAERVSCEDVDWAHKIAFYADSMQYKPILLTHYILSNTSQTGCEYKSHNTVFHRLIAGKRVIDLLSLYDRKEEQKQIISVAQSTILNGLVFLCALTTSPRKKSDVIIECVPEGIDWRREIRFVRKFPYAYGIFSSAVAPLFRTAIYLKRYFVGR